MSEGSTGSKGSTGAVGTSYPKCLCVYMCILCLHYYIKVTKVKREK